MVESSSAENWRRNEGQLIKAPGHKSFSAAPQATSKATIVIDLYPVFSSSLIRNHNFHPHNQFPKLFVQEILQPDEVVLQGSKGKEGSQQTKSTSPSAAPPVPREVGHSTSLRSYGFCFRCLSRCSSIQTILAMLTLEFLMMNLHFRSTKLKSAGMDT